MKKTNKTQSGRLWMLQSAAFVILLAASAAQSQAQIFNIGARNTSLQINLAGGGLSNWTVNGVNQLNNQWFYYGVGSGLINSIDTIAPWTTPTTTPGNAPSLSETYANSSLSVTTSYTLQSQPVGTPRAQLATTISLLNLSGTTQTYHLYQYSDFNLGGIPGGQSVQFAGLNAPYQVTQTGNGGNLIGTITSISGGTSDSVEVEAALFNGQQFGLTNFGGSVTLNNTLSAGPGNVDFAYEIDATVAPESSITVSEIQLVPEPSSLALLSSGILALTCLCRRKLVSLKKS